MRALDGIKALIAKFAARLEASRRAAKFTCGDCERNESCGLPPHADCAVKAAQLEREEDNNRERRYANYYKAVWPR